jgi:hypothetical protein
VNPSKVTIYCDSHLTSAAATELAGGPFGTVVLPYTAATANVAKLKAEGIVRNVLFAVRDCGVDRADLARAMDDCGIDGIDLDPDEVGPMDFEILVELTNWAASLGKIVIASPSDRPRFWIDLLEATGDHVSWWNLQLYHGADYAVWVSAAEEIMTAEAARRFVVPGYRAAWSSPDTIARELQQWGADGVFIRSWEQARPRASEWAHVLRAQSLRTIAACGAELHPSATATKPAASSAARSRTSSAAATT